MSTKIITLDGSFSTGEPTVQIVSTWGRNGRILREQTSLHKVASIKSPALDYIKNVTPEPGKTIVLVVGLGDHETYGPNRNGDGFPSEPVAGKIDPDQVLTKHYQSYKKAHVFRHHVNSDPAKAIGRVKEAFWNPYMRRVEILEDFEHSKAPDLLEKIAAGEYPSKSLGCRIKYDVCTLCGNRAKTRQDYCDHLKYEMGRIDSHTGKQAAALNPSPDFFDSSWVIRPADRTGYMLKKVAYDHPYEIRSSYELGEEVDNLKHKSAALRKAADIEKIIEGNVEGTASSLSANDIKLLKRYKDEVLPHRLKHKKPLSIHAVRIISHHKPGDVLKTTEDLGMPLGFEELVRYFMSRVAPDCECDHKTIKSASAHYPALLQVFADNPRFYDDVVSAGQFDDGKFNTKLADALYEGQKPQLTSGDYFKRKFLPASIYEGAPRTDVHTWTDPNTGARYTTNQGAITKTHDALTAHGLKAKAFTAAPLLGASALLGTAGMVYHRRGVPSRGKAIAAGLGSLATGALGLKKALQPVHLSGPVIQTDQGKPISGWTEMVRTASTESEETTYLTRRMLDKTTHDLQSVEATKLAAMLKVATIASEDSGTLGTSFDFEVAANQVGSSIVKLALIR